jgi:hypothetical protein
MPVRKFRSIEELAEAAPVTDQPAGEYLRSAFELASFARHLRPWRSPRGVFPNRSLAEAQERRRRWEAEGAVTP